jgi:hypothetical protein
MDRKEMLWVGRGEALGRLLSESPRAPSRPAVLRPTERRPTVDRFADPLEAARFSASIALAMRNGADDMAKEARADAMRAAFRWLVRTVRAGLKARPMTGKARAPIPAPVSMRRQGR